MAESKDKQMNKVLRSFIEIYYPVTPLLLILVVSGITAIFACRHNWPLLAAFGCTLCYLIGVSEKVFFVMVSDWLHPILFLEPSNPADIDKLRQAIGNRFKTSSRTVQKPYVSEFDRFRSDSGKVSDPSTVTIGQNNKFSNVDSSSSTHPAIKPEPAPPLPGASDSVPKAPNE